MANEIYVDPNATSAAVIQVAGECYQRVGGVPVAPQVFTVDGEFDSCGGCGGGCTISPTVISFVTGGGSGSVKVCGLTPNTTYSISSACPGYSAPASITTDATGCATFTVTATSSAAVGSSCTFDIVGTTCSVVVSVGGCGSTSTNHPVSTLTFDFIAPSPSTADCSPSSAGYGCGCFASPDGCSPSGFYPCSPTGCCEIGAELVWCPPTGTFTASITLNPGSWKSPAFSGATYSPSCSGGVWPCAGLSPSWTTGSASGYVSMSCYTAVSGGVSQVEFGLVPNALYWEFSGGQMSCPCGWGSGSPTDRNGIWYGYAPAPMGSGGYALAPLSQTVTMKPIASTLGCPPRRHNRTPRPDIEHFPYFSGESIERAVWHAARVKKSRNPLIFGIRFESLTAQK